MVLPEILVPNFIPKGYRFGTRVNSLLTKFVVARKPSGIRLSAGFAAPITRYVSSI